MIKAIVTDVDGVLVGTKEAGYFPYPSPEVISAVNKIKQQIPIILCSGKPSFGLLHVIKSLTLNNLHIATNGAVIFNPYSSELIVKYISNNLSKTILQQLLKSGINANYVGALNFYHLKNNVTLFVKKLAEARFTNPILVDDLIKSINKHEVVRIDTLVSDLEKPIVEKIIKPYLEFVELSWTTVQFDPTRIGLITPKGISKAKAFKKVSQKINIPTEEFLGIGDGMNDWEFMQLCGQIGIMGNAQKELINASEKFGKNKIIGGHVDKDGVIDIFKYYHLI